MFSFSFLLENIKIHISQAVLFSYFFIKVYSWVMIMTMVHSHHHRPKPHQTSQNPSCKCNVHNVAFPKPSADTSTGELASDSCFFNDWICTYSFLRGGVANFDQLSIKIPDGEASMWGAASLGQSTDESVSKSTQNPILTVDVIGNLDEVNR